MPDSWSVPIVPGVFSDLNETIAKGPDLSWINNLADNYFKGKNQRNIQDQRDVFKNLTPQDLNPTNLGTLLTKVANVQGASALPEIMNYGKMIYGQQANEGAYGSNGAAPTDAPGAIHSLAPPSSATAVPNNQPRAAQPNNPNDVPTGIIRPPGQNIGPGANVDYGAVETAGKGGFQSPPQFQPQEQPQQQPTSSPGNSLTPRMLAQKYGGDAITLASQLGVSPDESIDLKDPIARSKVVQVIRSSGQGEQPSPQEQPQPQGTQYAQAQTVPQGQPQQPAPMQGQFSQAGGNPAIADPSLGGLIPQNFVQKFGPGAPGAFINYLGRQVGSGMLSPDQAKSFQSRIDSVQNALSSATEPTPGMKDYAQAVRQGYTGTQEQFLVDQKMQQGRATKQGEAFATRYENLQETGIKAASIVPQLQIAKRITADPNFYSGFAANKVLIAKQIIGALGGDQNSAAPMQEAAGLVNSSILSGLKAIVQGTGQIRSAELGLMQSAAAAPIDSPEAYRFKLTVAERVQQQAMTLADLAQKYNRGNLDAGFDKVASDYVKSHPMFSPSELKNHHLLGLPQFSTPDEVRAAKLPRGVQFRVGNTDQIRMVQ